LTSGMAPIRRFRIALHLRDRFKPPVPAEGSEEALDTESYRVLTLEVVTCPEDGQPTLVSECGLCPKFIRRYEDRIYHMA